MKCTSREENFEGCASDCVLICIQAKEEEERRAAEFASLKASLAAGDKLESAAAEQLIRYLLEEAEGSAAKVGVCQVLEWGLGVVVAVSLQ